MRGAESIACVLFYFIFYFLLMILISYLSVPRRQHALYLPVPLPPTHARMLGGGFAAERFPSCSPPLACGAVPQEGGSCGSPPPRPLSLHLSLFVWGKCPRGGGFPAAAVAVPPRVPVGSGGDCGVPRSLPCPPSTAPGAFPYPRTAAAPSSPSSALRGGGTATALPPTPAFGRGRPQPGAVGTPLWPPSSIPRFGALLPGPKFWAVLFVCIIGRERLRIIGVVLRIPSPSALAAELYIPPPPSLFSSCSASRGSRCQGRGRSWRMEFCGEMHGVALSFQPDLNVGIVLGALTFFHHTDLEQTYFSFPMKANCTFSSFFLPKIWVSSSPPHPLLFLVQILPS